ncbi:ORF1ab polyprotein [Suncus murinus coronavirus Xingguo-74]|uniref:ORF1ab polyprotein n=1 Tax=Suncus murinus coronavirus Xingguo-74 TaxID=2848125 RepID=A0A240FW11_9ALPC|nr:ORF1ab polyprotein [Wencheng Sm shrew coronavirus]ASF90443.1 ORF1ab polyprotein [Suncus murinus coronavirus Xingguo-74]
MSVSKVELLVPISDEVDATHFGTFGVAVEAYASAAPSFEGVYFVAYGLQDIVELGRNSYVMGVFGEEVLDLAVVPFGYRDEDLRGWLLFLETPVSYVKQEFLFRLLGGEQKVVYVDNYLCGNNGKPVVPKDKWKILSKGQQGLLADNVYYKVVWDVKRDDVPYEKQNMSSIVSIRYLVDIPHFLADGAVREKKRPPQDYTTMLVKGFPFLMAYDWKFVNHAVKCGKCDNHVVEAGAFESVITSCCRDEIVHQGVVTAKAGELVLTPLSNKKLILVGSTVLRNIGTAHNLSIWFVCSSCVANVKELHDLNFSVKQVAKFSLTVASEVNLEACGIEDLEVVPDDGDLMEYLIPSWLRNQSIVFFEEALDLIVKFLVKSVVVSLKGLVLLKEAIQHFTFRIIDGVVVCKTKCCGVLSKVFEDFVNFVVKLLNKSKDIGSFLGVQFRTFMNVNMMNDCLFTVKNVTVNGVRSMGLTTMNVIDFFLGKKSSVVVNEFEVAEWWNNSVSMVLCDAKPEGNGKGVVIAGQAFYNEGQFYWPLLKGTTEVAETLCFKKAGGQSVTFSGKDDIKEVEKVYRVKYELEFDSEYELFQKLLGKLLVESEFTSWNSMAEFVFDKVDEVENTAEVLVQTLDQDNVHVKNFMEFGIPEVYVYDVEGGADLTKPVLVSMFKIKDVEYDSDGAEMNSEDDIIEVPFDLGSENQEDDTEEIKVEEVKDSEVQESEADLTKIQVVTSKKPKPLCDTFKGSNDIVFLKQASNNCWINTTAFVLQVLGSKDSTIQNLYETPDDFINKVCWQNNTRWGDKDDVGNTLVKWFDNSDEVFGTMCISLKCACGLTYRDYLNIFCGNLSKNPNLGNCGVCNQTFQCQIVSLTGKMCFAFSPQMISDDILKEFGVVAAAVYHGVVFAGHWLCSDFVNRITIDGHGKQDLFVKSPLAVVVTNVEIKEEEKVEVEEKIVEPFLVRSHIKFFQLNCNQLLKLKPRLIVNAANSHLRHGGGLAAGLNDVTNGELQKQSNAYVKKYGPVPVGGSAFIRCKVDNNCLDILNIVAPRKGDDDVYGNLIKAYSNVKVEDAFVPILGCGIFGLPLIKSLRCLMKVIRGKVNVFVYLDSEVKMILDYFAKESKADVVDNVSVIKASSKDLQSETKKDIVQKVVASKEVNVKESSLNNNRFSVLSQKDTEENNALQTEVDKVETSSSVVAPDVSSVMNVESINDNTSTKKTTHKESVVVENLTVDIRNDVNIEVPVESEQNIHVSDIEDSKELKIINLNGRDSYRVDSNYEEEDADWETFYGFSNAKVFSEIDYSRYKTKFKIKHGYVALQNVANNCWVNSVGLMLQRADVVFNSEGLNVLWKRYLEGKNGGFIAFLYFIMNKEIGDLGDAEQVLLVLNKYIKCESKVIVSTEYECDSCENKVVTYEGLIAPVSLIERNFQCDHGKKVTTKVLKLSGDMIFVDVNGFNPFESNGFNLQSANVIVGDEELCHYWYWDKQKNIVFTGKGWSDKSVKDKIAYSAFVKNDEFKKKNKMNDTVVACEKNESSDYVGKFFNYGEKFLNIIVFFLQLFYRLVIMAKGYINKKDFRVVAIQTTSTSRFVFRSLVANLAGVMEGIKKKKKKISFCYKTGILLFGLFQLLLLVSQLDHSYYDEYSQSNFNKKEFCGKNFWCYLTLWNVDGLEDFPHLNIQWNVFKGGFSFTILPLFYMAIMFCFGSFYLQGFLIAMLFQWFSSVMGLSIEVLDIVNLTQFLEPVFCCFIFVKIFRFFHHVVFGCTKSFCKYCSKAAKQKKFLVSTIVNGSSKSFYVNANGGGKFCNKHNFYCKGCESYGVGNTFINESVADYLSDYVKHRVVATAPASKVVDKVAFENGKWKLYVGDEFISITEDLTSSSYTIESVLKNNLMVSNVVVVSDNSNMGVVDNACVYYSQLFCKPIFVVDRQLLFSLDIDYNTAVFDSLIKVCANSFNKDFTNCKTLEDCKKELDFSVNTQAFVDAVKMAHKYDVLLTDRSYNNFTITYAKIGDKLSKTDQAVCLRANVGIINHNVAVKENISVVWYYKNFLQLSEEGKKYIVKTTKAKGVGFYITFNDIEANTQAPVTRFQKNAGFESSFSWNVLLGFFVLTFMSLMLGFSYWNVNSLSDFNVVGFKYIENGRLKNFEGPVFCLYNNFINFDNWHYTKFNAGFKNDKNCPIVVGTFEDGKVIPNVPANVKLVGNLLYFGLNSVFQSQDNLCFDQFGLTENCVFNSACLKLTGIVGERVYCYSKGLVKDSLLYADILPHLAYQTVDGALLRLPKLIFSILGLKFVQLKDLLYCKMGECVNSQQGYCLGAESFMVYNKEYNKDKYVFCGEGFLGFIRNFYTTFNTNIFSLFLTTQVMINFLVMLIVLFGFWLVMRVRRMFGDFTVSVCYIVVATMVNSLSYLVTGNSIGLLVYGLVYFFVTLRLNYTYIWHMCFIIAYLTIAPMWTIFLYVFGLFYYFVPNVFKLGLAKGLYEGEVFVGTFDSASQATFLLNKDTYVKLVNSLSRDKLEYYASKYNQYKYYQGSGKDGEYLLACKTHLAKALADFANSQVDVVYLPPTVTFTSRMQAGLRKILQPTGVVESCVVKVSYGSLTLNGLWLGNNVYCPRHVIAEDVTKEIDYETCFMMMRKNMLEISYKNSLLKVNGVNMKGSLLVIEVDTNNVLTPDYEFVKFKSGVSFNILVSYDGIPSGVFGVTMRSNGTCKGSFLNGSCGSPGFILRDNKVCFGYMHQMEFNSGVHVGSDMDGNIYGNYKDQPVFQIEGLDVKFADNVIAFLYSALINGDNWWLTTDECTVSAFNDWACTNNFTQVENNFGLFENKTGVKLERILYAIRTYSKGFGNKTVLGFGSLTDEFTSDEIYSQTFGILQASKLKSGIKNVLVTFVFCCMFLSEWLMMSAIYYFSKDLFMLLIPVGVLISFVLSLLVKHKIMFINLYLLPTLIVMMVDNFSLYMYVANFMSDFNMSGFNLNFIVSLVSVVAVFFLHLYRFINAKKDWFNIMVALVGSLWFYMTYNETALLTTVLISVNPDWYIGLVTYHGVKIAFKLMGATFTYKYLALCYVSAGFVITMRFGVLYWINKFTGFTFGKYDYKVSAREFKYIVANGLKTPTGVFETLKLNYNLIGIGGNKNIKVSTVQSKLTDIKCCNVVLLGLLNNLGVSANSKEWNWCVSMHNKICLSNDESVVESLLALVLFFMSKCKNVDLDALLDVYFDNNSILQSVASTFASLPSFVAYETAREAYEKALKEEANAVLLKQLKKAMNIAKSEHEQEVAVQRKLERLAETAAAQMYKDVRASDKKAKVISAMHSMLFSMLRRLDMSSVDNVLNLAKDGVVPLSIVPVTSASRMIVVVPTKDVLDRIVIDNSVIYAGVVWTIIDIKDVDNKVINLKEVMIGDDIAYPLHITVERFVKLQNNEILPGVVKQRVVKAEGGGFNVEGKALYTNEQGKGFVYALIAEKDGLTHIKWDSNNEVITIELERASKFLVDRPNGTPKVMYLYFVKNLNTLRRGAVLGWIGASMRLQAGRPTEFPENSNLLSICAFAVDPAKAYLDAIKSGVKPLANCIKMLSNGSGNGQAVSYTVDAKTNQDSYGGASVCIYCRAYVEHPTVDGLCQFKGRFVQVPLGTKDPVGFCIENSICSVCKCWIGHGCVCDRSNMQTTVVDNNYLNRARGSSGARLEPCGNGTEPDVVVRAFDICNKGNACLAKAYKRNCCRFKNVDLHDAYYIIKRVNVESMEFEKNVFESFKGSNCVAEHDFFKFHHGRQEFGNICRKNLTKYTMMDLCFALRNFDENHCEVLKEILVLIKCCDEKYFENKLWFDPIENEDLYKVYAKLGHIVNTALLKCVEMCDLMVAKGYIGVLTLDNQDLNGNFYDFGDFMRSPPGMGVPVVTSYLSYMMPIMSMTDCLACERYVKSDIYGKDFKTYELLKYDFTDFKLELFSKYFKYWDRVYHPNCVECFDDDCIIHCANFNTLFSMVLPETSFGPLCKKVYIDGVSMLTTAGFHFKQLGVVWNKDLKLANSHLEMTDLMRFVSDPSLLIGSSDALLDFRTDCFSIAALSTGLTHQIVKPGHFNQEFYDYLVAKGFFLEGSMLTLKHFFFVQNGQAAITDFNYYRYNKCIMLDICQALFVKQVVLKYFECYEGGCLAAKDVIVTNLDKSAGYPLNKYGKARLYYETMSYEEQDELYNYTKRNVVPTMTQMNLKYAISGKDRARTVGGVNLVSTMTTRQYHQKVLKSIVNTRGATVVIGTTKFYGGWDDMLKRLIQGVENPCLMGWDYPKCDRSLPNMIRMISAMVLGSKHVTCCTHNEKFYRLSNELAQVLTETAFVQGGLYVKPGGTTSGDASTAYANSVFNIFQSVSSNVQRLLSVNTADIPIVSVKRIQYNLYHNIYRSCVADVNFVQEYYDYLQKHFSLMILSDDGVCCYNKDYASMGYVSDMGAFKALLYYQNGVFMSNSKCWVEEDLEKGPHEFCSQHTLLIKGDNEVYLPYPDPSRILSAGVFVDDVVKSDNVLALERYVSLAIDAYPLVKHENSEYQKVFWVLLDWIKNLYSKFNQGVLDSFSIRVVDDAQSKFWEEDFYKNLYERSTILQSAGCCVVCNSQTILRCGDCIRRPLLCTKCAYDHVCGTSHKFILAITPYVCHTSGCVVNDVTRLYLGGMSYYCFEHKPKLSFPLVSNGHVFGLYKNSAVGSVDCDVFNRIATSDWSNVDDYVLANSCKESLILFAAETIKAFEESSKSSYACAILKEVIGPKEILLSWEPGKIRPPLNHNSVFICYNMVKDTRVQIGEYVFEKVDCSSDSVYFKSNATSKLVPGMIFVLVSHNVQSLKAQTIVSQEIYSKVRLFSTLNVKEDYVNLVPYYTMIGKQRVTTIQGPPGSGKSHCIIGLGLYYPTIKIVFTACSHAAVDSLCNKAFKNYNIVDCSRIIPARARVECFDKFRVNDCSAKYVFSTINALPDVVADVVVVDEVSMLTNYDLSVINSRVKYKHIVYVGDPQQLPSPRILITRGVLKSEDYNCVTRRMCLLGPDVFLNKCYRCPAEVVKTVSALVYENKFLAVNKISGKCFKVFLKGHVQVDNGSSVNRKQLDFVKTFLELNKEWQNAVFISPYNSQNYVASKMLGLQTQTVDSAQGSEYDYVIYTQTSDTAHACNINRFNVAITRTKYGILCIMNNKKMYDELDFGVIDPTVLHSTGLFKSCVRVPYEVGPAYATTFMHLTDRFKVSNDLAVALPSVNPTFEDVVNLMGFKLDVVPDGYNPLFCTKSYAIQHVRGWIGLDVESVHCCTDNIGTNLPLQIGFSNGLNFIVKPEACVMNNNKVYWKNVKTKVPPGEQFTHLIPLMRKTQDWSVVRKRIVSMLCDQFKGVTSEIIILTWAHGMELMTMRYFVKIGVVKRCYCGMEAKFYDSENVEFKCLFHGYGCDYLYNPKLVDVQQWGYVGKLADNHDMYCALHRNAHVASGDAIMTRCLAVYECFVKKVEWNIVYPYIGEEKAINAAGRFVERHIMSVFLKLYKPEAVHDIGNPKGIRCVVYDKSWYCYDKDPVGSNVKELCYDYETHGQFKGLMLFWNCNVSCYPEFSLVCRFDTRVCNKYNLEGVNGGSLYVNKHAFHTDFYDRRAFANLKQIPFFFFDDSECEVICDVVNYVPLSDKNCITKCNIGNAICNKHAKLYQEYLEKYNLFVSNGFNLWGPKSFDVYNLWSLLRGNNSLQALERLAYNVVNSGYDKGLDGSLPVAIFNDRVIVKKDLEDIVVFENKTALPTNVAFELYVRRNVGFTPPLSLLRNLSVVRTDRFCLWDYDDNKPFTNYTSNFCLYTDFDFDVMTCYDNSISGSLERFRSANNAVLFSMTNIRGLKGFSINYAYLNGKSVFSSDGKDIKLYFYIREKGVYVENICSFFTQGRTFDTFVPRSEMEKNFLNMETQDFIVKYGLEDYGFEHVVYGDVSKNVVGGLHLLISQVRLSKMGVLKCEHFGGSVLNTINCCSVIYLDNPSYKHVCTYMDLLLDDFVVILKSQDLSVVSKVVNINVDLKNFRFMLWCKDKKVSTFYPTLQNDWLCGYSMPNVYKMQNMLLERCDLPNYGERLNLPGQIVKNTIKYTQLCQYLNKTTICVPYNMRVVHFGASGNGVSPGTAVLKRWLPQSAILLDNDCRNFASDAVFTIIGSCEVVKISPKVDLIISDMYDCEKVRSLEENKGEDGFFRFLVGFIREKLSVGGTACIKITEFSWNKELYEEIQKFEFWTILCTSVNASSSEAFLIGVNYLGNFCNKDIIKGDVSHSNYTFRRNSTIMKQSYNSVLDLSKFELKLKTTTVVDLKDDKVNDLVLGLIKSGKLIIRDCGKQDFYANKFV